MIRTQIQISESQARKIRRAALEHSISFAEVVRRCIDQSLEGSGDLGDRYARARRMLGRVRESRGKKNISREHDRYLEDAFS